MLHGEVPWLFFIMGNSSTTHSKKQLVELSESLFFKQRQTAAFPGRGPSTRVAVAAERTVAEEKAQHFDGFVLVAMPLQPGRRLLTS